MSTASDTVKETVLGYMWNCQS